jgi:hypothetical protein
MASAGSLRVFEEPRAHVPRSIAGTDDDRATAAVCEGGTGDGMKSAGIGSSDADCCTRYSVGSWFCARYLPLWDRRAEPRRAAPPARRLRAPCEGTGAGGRLGRHRHVLAGSGSWLGKVTEGLSRPRRGRCAERAIASGRGLKTDLSKPSGSRLDGAQKEKERPMGG